MKRFLWCLVVALALGGWLPGAAWAVSLPADEAAIYYNGERQECNAWLKDEQRDKIVECLKTAAALPEQVDEQADTLINPAKLQVARPIQAYYYNGADFEQLYILYPLVYQGSVKYLISARQMPESQLDDIFYSFNEKPYTPAVKQVLDAGGALALVHDANRTYIYDGTNWQLIYEVKDVHLRDPEGPELDLTAQIDASGLQLTALADPVSVEDAYLGRLPRVAPSAD